MTWASVRWVGEGDGSSGRGGAEKKHTAPFARYFFQCRLSAVETGSSLISGASFRNVEKVRISATIQVGSASTVVRIVQNAALSSVSGLQKESNEKILVR